VVVENLLNSWTGILPLANLSWTPAESLGMLGRQVFDLFCGIWEIEFWLRDQISERTVEDLMSAKVKTRSSAFVSYYSRIL
jgi:hypothetical protein